MNKKLSKSLILSPLLMLLAMNYNCSASHYDCGCYIGANMVAWVEISANCGNLGLGPCSPTTPPQTACNGQAACAGKCKSSLKRCTLEGD